MHHKSHGIPEVMNIETVPLGKFTNDFPNRFYLD